MWPLLIIFLAVVLDQFSKWLILSKLQPGISVAVIQKFFSLSLVFNPGAAFGKFGEFAFLLSLVSIGAIIIFSFFLIKYRRSEKRLRWHESSLALIIGGAMGNLIDRLRFGYVIDFLDFHIWPVFNLADSMITVGTCILIVLLLKKQM